MAFPRPTLTAFVDVAPRGENPRLVARNVVAQVNELVGDASYISANNVHVAPPPAQHGGGSASTSVVTFGDLPVPKLARLGQLIQFARALSVPVERVSPVVTAGKGHRRTVERSPLYVHTRYTRPRHPLAHVAFALAVAAVFAFMASVGTWHTLAIPMAMAAGGAAMLVLAVGFALNGSLHIMPSYNIAFHKAVEKGVGEASAEVHPDYGVVVSCPGPNGVLNILGGLCL